MRGVYASIFSGETALDKSDAPVCQPEQKYGKHFYKPCGFTGTRGADSKCHPRELYKEKTGKEYNRNYATVQQ